MRDAVLVLVGGAAGGSLRHLITQALPAEPVPWSVLAINALGAFALAVLLARTTDGPTWVRPALGTGLLGGFTTFSAVSAAAVQAGPLTGATVVALGLAAAVAGAAAGTVVGTRRRPAP